MKVLLTVCFYTLSLMASAADYRIVHLNRGRVPVGGIDHKYRYLQSEVGSYSTSNNLNVLFGDNGGTVLSVGKTYQKMRYHQAKTDDRSLGKYLLIRNSLELGFGLWGASATTLRFEIMATLGYGKVSFKEKNQAPREMNNVLSGGIQVRGIYPIAIKDYGTVDFMFGGGVDKNFISSFRYKERNFKRKEFPAHPYIDLGLGLRF